MDHQEAIRIKAAEQYLLGELPTTVRDEFEEHFMTCGECASDLRAGAAFLGNVKEAFQHETAPEISVARPERRQSWIAAFFRPSIAAPAFVVLLAVIAYQGLVTVPRLRSALSGATTPVPMASFSLLSGSSRGEASVPVAVGRNHPFGLYVDIPPQPLFPLYTLEVESAGGASEFSLPVSAAQARNTVEVFVPAGRLDPGDYEIVIRGAQSQGDAGAEIGRVRFSLKYAD
jgi:hypothetical protein